MKRFEIVNGMRHNMEPCAVLVWDDDSNFLSIDIDESATEKDVPMLFIPFLRKGQHHIDDAWARRWVEERVVPSDGQNLGQVLRANGLQPYDSMLLLIAGEGRCAQDDFFIQEARGAVASESVSSRVGNIVRQAREQAGISQVGLAEECGMRQPTLSRIERGATNPTVETLNDIAKTLGKRLEVRFV